MARRKTKPDEGLAAPQILTEEQIRRKVRSEGMWHPITKISTAIAVTFGVFALFALLSSTFIELLMIFGVVAVVFVLLGAGNSAYQINIKGKIAIMRMSLEVSRLQKQQQAEDEDRERRERKQKLAVQFQEYSRAEYMGQEFVDMGKSAFRELDDLASKYRTLQELIDSKRGDETLSFNQTPGLALNLYDSGLDILEGVSANMSVLLSSDEQKLINELEDRKNDLARLKLDTPQDNSSLLATVEESIRSHQQRIDNLQSRRAAIKEGLLKADACEDALIIAADNIAQMRTNQGEASLNEINGRLERATRVAREVSEKMKEMEGLGV